MLVRDVMKVRIIKVSPDNSVKQAAELMLANRVSGIPVIDDEGQLVGLITEGDLLRRSELGHRTMADESLSPEEKARTYIKSNAWKVADVMSRNPVSIGEDTPLARVANLMEEHGIKRLPVTRAGAVVGIVSRADLLQAIIFAKPDETAPGDEAIRRSILIRLNENTGLEGQDLTVTVANGVVHLWGNVSTEECRKAARVAAESVRGVAGVVDHFPKRET
ncbi:MULTISPECIES: CBS domain-containing protein [unclassified Rhizobium]|uniref:CBS domain-containing protein n=1 Tax=unclassified Rhizobium TaxID=2613769 RepID=UPI000CDF4EEC|nr:MULTISPECIES: CBS domain-containing protein [Rhizobium]AVA26366.1 CBS/BON domain-containing protein [Rhizobium sp. NXC24]UWU24020.1 CBS domain-containing protein [Rhizobium tropici]